VEWPEAYDTGHALGMPELDDLIRANAEFAEAFGSGDLPAPPSRHLAVVTCMDARILPLSAFGLRIGDAHVLRNAGGRVTDDVLRSLLVSSHLLGTRSFAVVHHTQCGMVTKTDSEIRQAVLDGSGHDPGDLAFHAISDPEADLRADVKRITDSGLFPPDVDIRGFIYDVATGLLRQITP
jgi:carbonic anhydrase